MHNGPRDAKTGQKVTITWITRLERYIVRLCECLRVCLADFSLSSFGISSWDFNYTHLPIMVKYQIFIRSFICFAFSVLGYENFTTFGFLLFILLSCLYVLILVYIHFS